MKILIFEGIACSGKTSVQQKLIGLLTNNNISYKLVDEKATLMPLLDNKDPKISIEFLNRILTPAITNKQQVIIFDRLYFTHIFRTNSKLEDFKIVEDSLIAFNPTIIFLKITEQKIPESIQWAMNHRDQEWVTYVKSKGTDKQIFEYYISQQRKIEQLSQQTTLPTINFNTDNLNFDAIAQQIFNLI